MIRYSFLPSENECGIPSYLLSENESCKVCRLSLDKHRPLREYSDSSTINSLKDMMKVWRPDWLGVGKDVRDYPRTWTGGSLEFHCAWRVEDPSKWMMYDATLRKVKAEVDAIKGEGYRMKDCHVALRAGKRMPGGLMSDCNEHFLLSGTKPQPSLRINRYRHTGMPPPG